MSLARLRQKCLCVNAGECFSESNTPPPDPPRSLSLSDTNTRNTHSYLQSTPLPGQIWQIKRAATTLAAHCSCRELCCEECSDSHLASISDMSCFGVLLEADVLFTAGLAKQGFIRGRTLHIRVILTAHPFSLQPFTQRLQAFNSYSKVTFPAPPCCISHFRLQACLQN